MRADVNLSIERFRECVTRIVGRWRRTHMWSTARGDVDPVPRRICLEIFEMSSALARKRDRFRFGRDPQDTDVFLRNAFISSKKKKKMKVIK